MVLSLNKANSLRMNNIRGGYNMEFKVIESAKDPLFNEALKLYDDKLDIGLDEDSKILNAHLKIIKQKMITPLSFELKTRL